MNLKKWSELTTVSDRDLVRMHDRVADHTVSSLNIIRDELMRRELQRSADASHRLAEQAVEEARLQRQISDANLNVARTAMWLAAGALVVSVGAILVPLLS